jgi:hypothetical protein
MNERSVKLQIQIHTERKLPLYGLRNFDHPRNVMMIIIKFLHQLEFS